jgi:hypothetical protein
MVVSHVFVFNFDLDDTGPGSLDSSTTPPRACRRNGFQCEMAVRVIVVVVALRSVALSAHKIWVATRGEWFAMCERITFGRHACGAARANVDHDTKNTNLLGARVLPSLQCGGTSSANRLVYSKLEAPGCGFITVPSLRLRQVNRRRAHLDGNCGY